MNFLGLTLLVWLPIVVGAVLLRRKGSTQTGRVLALAMVAWSILLMLALLFTLPQNRQSVAVERYSWLASIGLEYHLAADGISVTFLLLCGVVFLMGVLASRQFLAADDRYYGLTLVLFGGLLGTFTAQNFLHFFLYWELSLIPAFFLVKLYGGGQRSFAATQFFIYTMAGSIAMLIAFLALGYYGKTFAVDRLAALRTSALPSEAFRIGVFVLAFLGVAVKVPIWPLHSWLPATYSEAPTPVTMMLTGAMSKMGVYALLRWILPIFPTEMDALHRPLLTLAVVTILYGAWAAYGQRDFKRLFAYSSLSHLGYCFLAVFAAARSVGADLPNERAAAINGVVLQVVSHGILAAGLFACISFLERRADGARSVDLFGGIRKINPVLAGFMGILVFASLGLPGLSGFPAEFLIFKGSFSMAPAAASFAAVGLLLTAAYLLKFFGQVFLGPLNSARAGSIEITASERWIILPALAIAFILGWAPQIALNVFNPVVTALVQQMR